MKRIWFQEGPQSADKWARLEYWNFNRGPSMLDAPISSKQFFGLKFCLEYRKRAIIGRSRFEAALIYKPRILGLINEEFLFLVHKLSVI